MLSIKCLLFSSKIGSLKITNQDVIFHIREKEEKYKINPNRGFLIDNFHIECIMYLEYNLHLTRKMLFLIKIIDTLSF
ncbi:hypothetical protein ERICV_03608 [Paenibacillus larvae subsp. larvae]|uniref:Uncharacterized protein n=1 Tax=Paenibacillus larvae subsp. larvae TaxID=147375 RepID=A0A6C0QW78_9BACL|nr:hypothetical protein ERICV_03608 [Paenibacillus larvae subsp. larvae]